MLGMECSTVCNRDLDVDADRRLEAPEMWIWRMERSAGSIEVTNEEAVRREKKDGKILNSTWQMKHQWIDHVLRHSRLLHEIKCDMIWKMMVALLHSSK